ncbi:ferritin-like domain-containing protein [Nannocystis bainbridge]|uniref:Ferritin-like domain-containing protein n=1 Tax=Nannocystis bainbridge TaxID=2995303 RepID=A0ABT5DUC7_9BACT|nr:ferritin-like domain-containing protein [Nannocystis bainbridge]MDC0716728.1 ferritin-like domain-containing protein [Nannocystis bainbridge]
MRNDPWTPDALLDHLQKAVYLELWTIPLYLTAAYSLQVPGTDAQHPPTLTPVRSRDNPNRSREQLAFNNIYSIVVQEMLHLELAANLYNALFAARGHAPSFTGAWAPRYDGFPPWIGSTLPVQLGAADATQMKLLAAVETPEPAADPPPDGPQAVYDSIGQFYKAIEQGLDALWDTLYDPAAEHRQKSEFADPGYPDDDYTGFSAVIAGDSATARRQADQIVGAIVGQGEGSRGPFIDADLRPEDLDDLEDRVSHFARFRMVQAMLKFEGPLRTYPTTGSSGLAAAQQQLDLGFSRLLAALEKGFAGADPLDLGAMWALPGQIVAVWAAGGVPTFR